MRPGAIAAKTSSRIYLGSFRANATLENCNEHVTARVNIVAQIFVF